MPTMCFNLRRVAHLRTVDALSWKWFFSSSSSSYSLVSDFTRQKTAIRAYMVHVVRLARRKHSLDPTRFPQSSKWNGGHNLLFLESMSWEDLDTLVGVADAE